MWYAIAKLTRQPFSNCIVILAIMFTIGLSTQYFYTSIDTTWYPNTYNFKDIYDNIVKSYKFNVSDVVLEMKGYNLTTNNTDNATIKLNGLDVRLNKLKRLHRLLNDPKLDKPLLPFKSFFLQDRIVKDVNCRLIINGNELETKIASNKSIAQARRNHLGPKDYINKTLDCKTFIAERGYVLSSLTSIEAAFPIAFSILMYKDIEQVERLLRAIFRPQNIYCIHVDKKTSDETYRAMKGIAKCFNNVFMTIRRIDVRWGMFSVLEPELMCMEALLQRHKTWKYFINLTGQHLENKSV